MNTYWFIIFQQIFKRQIYFIFIGKSSSYFVNFINSIETYYETFKQESSNKTEVLWKHSWEYVVSFCSCNCTLSQERGTFY